MKTYTCIDCKQEIEGRYRRLPNKLVVCEQCYGQRNPLRKFAAAEHVYRNRQALLDRHLLSEQDVKEMDREGPPPPLHRVYKHPLVNLAYNMMKKGKRSSVGDDIAITGR